MTAKVTVVGAGFYGSTTAQRLAEYDIFDTVVLTDIVEGKPEGLALDLNQSRPVEGFDDDGVYLNAMAVGGDIRIYQNRFARILSTFSYAGNAKAGKGNR